ncbi:hypothetical protein DBR33_07590 [Stenotrophomonas sp. HMWF022]|nr:hypothetical protein DBR33_07590 [Stenotrophomonas sp. HMWF022]
MDHWNELLGHTLIAFVMGAALGFSTYFSSDGSGSIVWGSFADGAAALGTWIAAISAILIAKAARREVLRRENEARNERARRDKDAFDLAVSFAAWPIFADMELAVRISRNLPLEKVNVRRAVVIIDWIARFSVPNELGDIGKLLGLPQGKMRIIVDCRAQLKMIQASASNQKSVLKSYGRLDQLQIQYLVAQVEIIAVRMREVADYLYDEIGAKTPRPWLDWVPFRDFPALDASIRAVYHQD